MKLCPICDGEANSHHHITVQISGRVHKSPAKIWLCKKCHDDIEGLDVNVYLIAEMRREKIGKTLTFDPFTPRYRDNNKRVRVPIVPLPDPKNVYDFRIHRKRGRPRYVIPDGERIILEDGGTSLLEKAQALGVSVKTVRRRLREAQASYDTQI